MKKLAHAWQEGKILRDFSAALEVMVAEADLPEDVKQELKAMVEWSARHADYVDPLTDLKWTLGQFRNPPWVYGY